MKRVTPNHFADWVDCSTKALRYHFLCEPCGRLNVRSFHFFGKISIDRTQWLLEDTCQRLIDDDALRGEEVQLSAYFDLQVCPIALQQQHNLTCDDRPSLRRLGIWVRQRSLVSMTWKRQMKPLSEALSCRPWLAAPWRYERLRDVLNNR